MGSGSIRRESSFGVIPLKKIKGKWHLYLVKHGAGHWSFPKGHAEQGEEPQQTAVRELFEETGLTISKFYDMPPLQEEYFFRQGKDLIAKTVTYFLAEVKGRVKIQLEEISEGAWVELQDAPSHITYPESKKICQQVVIWFME